MKIRSDTPDLLIVEDRPWILGLMIILFILAFCAAGLFMILDGEWMGLPFLVIGGGIGLVAFWAFVRRVQVVFYRPGGWAEIRRANVFRRRATRFDLEGVHHALVETSHSDGDELYRLALFVEKGGVSGTKPLTLAYSNIGDPHSVAAAINAWLGASETG